MKPKPRSGKPMVTRPYVPETPNIPVSRQHPVARRLGPSPFSNPAFMEIVQASEEIAAELGKTADQLTEEEVDRAFELGRLRHDQR